MQTYFYQKLFVYFFTDTEKIPSNEINEDVNVIDINNVQAIVIKSDELYNFVTNINNPSTKDENTQKLKISKNYIYDTNNMKVIKTC